MIKILTKICGKITIIVVTNGEPYYFIIIYKCKEFPLSLFSYQMLASTFDSDERSSYYKVCDLYKDIRVFVCLFARLKETFLQFKLQNMVGTNYVYYIFKYNI